ncbi:DUF192 domain-containing protein [bacterium]|nr:DUF192 domain-containing protein [bacterium]
MKIIIIGLFILALATLSCQEKKTNTLPTTQETPSAHSQKTKEQYTPKLPTHKLQIDTFSITVEVAKNNNDRMRGLMFRTYLPDTAGMLFIFEDELPHSFWMKNTLIPLSIAFIDADWVITDIKWMKPGDLSSHYPSKPVLYALEMKRGWFSSRGIKPGDKVKFSN